MSRTKRRPAPADIRAGVDVGGTKIEIAALDRTGAIIFRDRAPTPRGDYDATLNVIAMLVQGIDREVGRAAPLGVAIPGAISPATGLVKNANSTWLIGRPLAADLTAKLARPLRIANDANCFALSEAVDGAGAGAGTVFGVILGTGVGGGIVRNGAVIEGRNAIAGEWGHNPLPWPEDDERDGPTCYCGRKGCIETFLSGPALAHDHHSRTGQALSVERIAQNADAGHAASEETMRRYERRLARGLAAVINIVDPDRIVLGGGLSNISRLYHNVPWLWRDYIFSDVVRTELLAPAHGDSSGVRGAAWLWPVEI